MTTVHIEAKLSQRRASIVICGPKLYTVEGMSLMTIEAALSAQRRRCVACHTAPERCMAASAYAVFRWRFSEQRAFKIEVPNFKKFLLKVVLRLLRRLLVRLLVDCLRELEDGNVKLFPPPFYTCSSSTTDLYALQHVQLHVRDSDAPNE